ncbi:hypothetical protein PRIPAC_97225 [Pristionchus pacificus]|uniref:Uncharacterized protein n=1 Tax=Pristionchus pacificus TaxID=54126 RepID=A0A2A6BC65_PRIPA|nr:hypothetical protein PRIPAC_97225 [Pristionchus pacificus]|eukprot:PDM63470.1 hypothetical protein PRIPAC_53827 [Pristionchus pacificus]
MTAVLTYPRMAYQFVGFSHISMDTSKINNSTEHIFDGDIAMASKIEHYLLSDDSATLHVNCFSSEEEEQTKVCDCVKRDLERIRGTTEIDYTPYSDTDIESIEASEASESADMIGSFAIVDVGGNDYLESNM